MKRAAAAMLLLLALALPSRRARAGSNALDGTEWTMSLDGIYGWVTRDDRLRYDAGTFTSSQCIAEGFVATGYEGDAGHWSAAQSSPSAGSVEWAGARDGDRMTGTLTWTKKDGSRKTYHWSATRRDASKK